ncbi:MAG: hypothetical protein IRZ26_05875 [Clostridia bacterium]|nr:hypothetical protein [Clostridia bacterium]MCL6522292.1 DUF2103 domain-containing protein [Bacillota bacterium]
MARFRAGPARNVKKRHHVVPGLEALVDRIGAAPGVEAVIPGRIRPLPRGVPPSVTFQYRTESGFKLLGRAGGAVQEIFVVSAEPDEALRRCVEAGLVEPLRGGRDDPGR